MSISARKYVSDGLDLLAELDGAGSLVGAFTHGPGIDDPLMMRYDGADYYYLKNHQGSVLDLTTAGGTVAKTYKYDAYGNLMQETGPTINRGFTYTSRQYHFRSGLYYYRARWYSPQLGRFLTQDPIGALGGVNLYAYVGNDPANWVDALGLIRPFYPYSPGQAIRDYLAPVVDAIGSVTTPKPDLSYLNNASQQAVAGYTATQMATANGYFRALDIFSLGAASMTPDATTGNRWVDIGIKTLGATEGRWEPYIDYTDELVNELLEQNCPPK